MIRHGKALPRAADEAGIVLVVVILLTAIMVTVGVTLTALVAQENSHSRASAQRDGAYQAAEAGLNAYMSNLTENQVFYNQYMAKGEATRTDSNGVAHASSNTSDVAWNSASWGATWTYATPKGSDTGWYDLGNGYEYLMQVNPPNASLQGQAQVITRIVATGRPCTARDAAGACTAGSTDSSTWRAIELMIRPSTLADYQMFSAASIGYGPGSVTNGPVFVGENNSGVVGNLSHFGTAYGNLYAEGTVTVGGSTLQGGAKKYDKNTSPTALDKINNGSPIPFSSFTSALSTLSTVAQNGGIYLGSTDTSQSPAFNVDAWKLVFQPDGKVVISSCRKAVTVVNGKSKTWEVYDASGIGTAGPLPVCNPPEPAQNVPSNGAIYSVPDVIVSGVVKGKVTVGSFADVVVGGDITYNTQGQDILGLDAQGSLIMAPYAVNGSTKTLTYYAATIAQTGSWEADPLWSSGANSKLNFYGATATYSGGATTNLFCSQTGCRNYTYDNNLKFLTPPWFPTVGNSYTIVVQREIGAT